MLRAPSCVLLLGLGLSACIAPPSATTRLAESAYDLNESARFGRMDLALEHVRETAREEFSRKHSRWGKAVRVVDYEVASVNIRKDGDADVTITINWQRADETSMRATELTQRWSDKRGTWWLLSEDERAGDPGLLSVNAPQPMDDSAPATLTGPTETPTAGTPTAPPRSRFQTRVIYEQ